MHMQISLQLCTTVPCPLPTWHGLQAAKVEVATTTLAQTVPTLMGRHSKDQMWRISQPGAPVACLLTDTHFMVDAVSNVRAPEVATAWSLPSGDHSLPGEMDRWIDRTNAV